MKMQNKVGIYIAVLVFIFIGIGVVSAVETTLGTFRLSQNITLPQLANASYCNITSILLTDTGGNIIGPVLNGPVSMTKQGVQFNYTLDATYTNRSGVYLVNGECDQTVWVYDFEVNTSGQDVSSPQSNTIIFSIFMMIFAVTFFFILSFLFKHPGTKIFFMALSSLTLIVTIGMITANAVIYLGEFPNLVSIYNNYYVLIIILAGTAMAGVILWLVYYSFTWFNKLRGRVPED